MTCGHYHRNQRQGRRRGSTLILVAAGMVAVLAMCAFAVDYGALVEDANKVQRACDAAALAGASQLRGGATGDPLQERQDATVVAVKTAAENDVTIPTNGKSNNSPDIWFDDNGHPTTITVRATSDRAFYFGRLTGYPHGRATRQATATIGPCNSPPPNARVVPLGITQSTYDAYSAEGTRNIGKPDPKFETFTLIQANKTTFARDDLVEFDMRGPNGKSPAHFESQLVGDDVAGRDFPAPTINPPTFETTLNASLNPQGERLEDGMGQLFQRAVNAPWNDAPITDTANPYTTVGQRYSDILNGNSPVDANGNANPRIMNLIVTPDSAGFQSGTTNLQIVGYAPVYIQQVAEDPTTGAVTVTVGFLPANITSSSSCGGTTSGSLTGNRAVKLIG